MKLLSCYIAGFGKFKDVKLDLSQNFVEIKRDNGWGKTTLAEFIISMLFGLESSRAKGVADNKRLRYQPFAGGNYGGVLEVFANGRIYRIERSFGQTASNDSVKVYDENNRLLPDFTGENIGEKLLEVNRETFEKSAYLPQENKAVDLPEDMKGRLLALLSQTQKGESADGAILRLEKAERELRAKRKPAKGKLDSLEERLQTLARERDEALRFGENVTRIQAEITEKKRQIAQVDERLKTLSSQTEEALRAETVQSTYGQFLESAKRAERDREKLLAFFAGQNPKNINVSGLQEAVAEFYALKNQLTPVDGENAETLRLQIESLEKRIEAYETAIKQEESSLKEKNKRKKSESKAVKGKKWTMPILIVGLLAVFFGLAKIDTSPLLSYPVFAVGAVGVAIGFLRLLKSAPRFKKTNSSVRGEYEDAKAELTALRERLGSSHLAPTQAQEKRVRMQSLESAIVRFLSAFQFEEEIYDYRTALRDVKENILRFAECEQMLGDKSPSAGESAWDLNELKRERKDKEKEKEELLLACTRLEEEQKRAEEKRFLAGDIQNEIARLTTEHERLTGRYQAVVMAKELLLRARDNMAGQYLVPVQKACAEYLRFMGYDSQNLRLGADGAPFFDEQGALRGLGYYSAGIKELVTFCMRIALATLVFGQEKPPLLLDDPFVNLDDNKTQQAKAFIKELSSRYQIIYFTCKDERACKNG